MKYPNADLSQLIQVTGWNDASLMSLYANFISHRQLDEEFTQWCRDQAEYESECSQDEDGVNAEADGGFCCYDCGTTGDEEEFSRMGSSERCPDCDSDNVGPSKFCDECGRLILVCDGGNHAEDCVNR